MRHLMQMPVSPGGQGTYSIREASPPCGSRTFRRRKSRSKGRIVFDRWKNATVEEQYVLYAAAINSDLLGLLTEWQPWMPNLEWSDLEACPYDAPMTDETTPDQLRQELKDIDNE